VLAVAGGLAAWWVPRARYRHWRYQVADDALELRHGVVRRIHSAIPYFRVQHIDVAQGPVERAVGLARLQLHTASAGTDATIPGIAAEEADGLRRLILARAGHGDAV
jgi:membrane protein YdbS with pleckstrin-like domain